MEGNDEGAPAADPTADSNDEGQEPADSNDEGQELMDGDDGEEGSNGEGAVDRGEGSAGGSTVAFLTNFPSQQYGTRDEAIAGVKAMARDAGIGVSIRNSRETYVMMICDRGRPYVNRLNLDDDNRRRETSTRSTGCPFSVSILLENGAWRASVTAPEHNHEKSPDVSAHTVHRRFTNEQYERIGALRRLDTPPTKILESLKREFPEGIFTREDVANAMKKMKREMLAGRTPTQALVEELEEAGVPHRKVVSEGGVLTHLFLASKESLNMLQDYHQAILLDCTYKTNIFEMPLLEIVGITSTGKSFTAACAFMRGETAPDYVWAMECFREALNGSEVHVLSTDKDDALAAAIAQVFPGADHLLCRWHVNKNVAAKCKPIFGDGERWDSFLKLFNAVCASPTADEYELRLMALLDAESGEDWAAAVRYVRSEWLSHKEKIVAAWTSLLLHFETTATSRVEGAHAALKRMLSNRTGDLLRVGHRFLDFLLLQFQELEKERATQTTRLLHATSSQRVLRVADPNHPSVTWRKDFTVRDFFSLVVYKLSHYALVKISAQLSISERPGAMQSCTKYYERVLGLPCAHVLKELIRNRQPLTLEHVNKQWHLVRQVPARTLLPPLAGEGGLVRDPTIERGRGRPRGGKTDNNSTRRDPSAFELAEKIQRICGKCHQPGHNARTCGRSASQRAGSSSQSQS